MIEELKTGQIIATRVLPVESDDLRSLRGWPFQWIQEAKQSEVVKLVTADDPGSILGLMSIGRESGFIEVKLLENSPPNVGRGKLYRGIAGSLLAFAADLSDRRGDEGYLRLTAKTELIDHYIREYRFSRLGRSQNMILLPGPAAWLIETFFGRTEDGKAS